MPWVTTRATCSRRRPAPIASSASPITSTGTPRSISAPSIMSPAAPLAPSTWRCRPESRAMTDTDRARLSGLHLHVDGASGAAGDMMLGALIDLGVPVDVIGDALDAIGAGRRRLQVARVVTHGIAALDVKVDTAGELAGMPSHHHAEPRRDHSHDHR